MTCWPLYDHQERRKFEEQRKAVQEQGAQADGRSSHDASPHLASRALTLRLRRMLLGAAALLERHQRKIAELQARRSEGQ